MTLVGKTVGRIRIVDHLGQGGMGDVYAGYDETLKRKVALKAIRNEKRFDAEAKARFLREARILSQLDHPGICQIHEFIEGDDSDFLVLELIAGQNLKTALENDDLSMPFKLHIAEQVTNALMAAHAKGIAHRDLKPENVMLTPEGGVKVLDFGIANTVDEHLFTTLDEDTSAHPQIHSSDRQDHPNEETAPTLNVTRLAARTTQPESAEQPLPQAAPPTDSEPPGGTLEDSTAEWGDRPRLSRPLSSEPEAIPATVLGTASAAGGDESPPSDFVRTEHGTIMGTVAYMSPEQARGERATVASDMYSLGLMLQEVFTGLPAYEPDQQLLKLLLKVGKGESLPVTDLEPDLTTLIERLKSLGPEARPLATETAERLAWIRGKPGRRLLRRLAMALIAIFLLGILKYTSDLRNQQRQADAARQEAEQVLEFVVGLFAVSNPNAARGNNIRASELLDAGAARINEALHDQPRSQARLMLTMGRVYRQLALYDRAEPLLEQALEIHRQWSDDDLETVRFIDPLAGLYYDQGEYERAEPLYRSALEIQENALGPEHPQVAVSLNNLAFLYLAQGRDGAAEPLLLRTLEIQQKVLGPQDPRLSGALNNLGNLYLNRAEHDRAEQLFQRAIEVQEGPEPDHPDLAYSLNNLGLIYHERDDVARAEPLFTRALEIQEKVLGSSHPYVANSLNNLAEVSSKIGNYARAEPLYERALKIQQDSQGTSHPGVAVTLSNLADLYSARGETQRASALYERALAIQESVLGNDHPSVAVTLNHQADLSRWDEPIDGAAAAAAEAQYRRALEIQESNYGREHPSVAITLSDMAGLLARQDRYDEALRLYLRAQASAKQGPSGTVSSRAGQRRQAAIQVGLGSLYSATGEVDRATESWQRAVATMTPLTADSSLVDDLHTHALALLHLGRVEEACPMVTTLFANGWRQQDFVELGRQNGLLPDLLPSAASSSLEATTDETSLEL